MSQTLLALLALAVGSMLVLQQTTQTSRTERTSNGHEVSTAAADAAVARLAFYGTLAFDEATLNGKATSSAQLKQTIAPYVFSTADTPDNDVDDYHGTTATGTRTFESGTIPFTVKTTVQYVSETDGDTPSLVATRFKKATVVVSAPGTADVRLSQLYMCGSRCAF